MKTKHWSYGITTVPERIHDLLPTTIKSLATTGFDCPRLFVDGTKDPTAYQRFRLPVTVRTPAIRTAGNWLLAAWELFLRNPSATYYALFQDDITACVGVREYIEKTEGLEKHYFNLCTYKQNEEMAGDRRGWYPSNQKGRGAQALVFPQEALRALLSQEKIVQRLLDEGRGWRSVDGTISIAMNIAGFTEYVHMPSLVDHIGRTSSMGNTIKPGPTTFPGNNYDVLIG